MAFVTGLGGALIRDGIFLQNGPPALTRHWGYLVAVLAGCLIGWILGSVLERFKKIIAMIDAIGLGAYSVVGVEKSLAAGLGPLAAIFVGVTNACGGGLLRDVITGKEPLMMKPGQFYVLASFLGSFIFFNLVYETNLGANVSALIAIGSTFLFRMLAIAFNWRTEPMRHWYIPGKHNFTKPEPLEENDES